METISVESLKKDASFTGDLILDSSFILLPQSAQLTEGMISALKNWGFENVLCDGNISLGGDIGISKEVEENFSPKNTTDKLSNTVKQAIEDKVDIVREDLKNQVGGLAIGLDPDVRISFGADCFDESIKEGVWVPSTDSYLVITAGNETVVVKENYTPNFKCSTDKNGKGILTSKVGLLTYDEAVHAGNYCSKGSNSYNINSIYYRRNNNILQ